MDFPGLSHYTDKAGPEKGRHAFNISLYGINLIKQLVTEHGLDCEFYVNHKIPWAGPQKLRIIPARIYKWYAQRRGVMSH